MKNQWFKILALAAALVLPAAAQQTKADDQQQPSATTSQSSTQSSSSNSAASDQGMQSSSSSSDQTLSSDQNLSARQPLQPDYHQGFWGKMNPFARKKYVQRQLSPIRNRVNELDDLTAQNAKQIKDVDARAQEGIRQASAKATEADQHATEAGNKAQQANQTALQASNRLNTVEQVVGNIDQYQPATQTEIRLRPGQTTLSPKAKQALDDMTADLKDQKGYIIEVQGFSTAGGQAGIQSSQAMANSVVRYLVEKNDVPVYRVFVMGLGNAKLPAQESENAKPAHGNRVEVSLLKNNVGQLASATQPDGMMGAGDQRSDKSSPYSSSRQEATPQHSANSAEVKSDSTNTPSPQQ